MLRSASPLSACLIDFGFSVRVDGACPPQRVLVGTPEFQSPEIVSQLPCDPRSCDCWALGVLSFMLLAGAAPFAHANRFLLAGQIRSFAQHLRLGALSEGARGFVAGLLSPLESRLTADQIASHP